MSWSYKATWPANKGVEIQAQHFEDIRQHIWAASQALAYYKNNGQAWDVADYMTYSDTYCREWVIEGGTIWLGYVVGDVIAYEGELWVCNTWFPATTNDGGLTYQGQNRPPKKLENNWKLAADTFNYRHFDHNADRYLMITGRDDSMPPYNRTLIKASRILPRQLIRNTQVYGATTWQPYITNYANGIYEYKSNYYICHTTHAGGRAFDGSKFTRVTQERALNPSQLFEPVEFAWRYITGAIGAIYPWPPDPQRWTPAYYNYRMNFNLPYDAGTKYDNPKMAEAYQAAVELVASGGWYWPGMSGYNIHSETPNPVDFFHRLGDGDDTSGTFHGEFARGNYPYNKSAFEECLDKCGSFDWYLDLNVPPQRSVNPYNNSLACWRRTWKYAMDYPAGVGQTANWYQIQMMSVPANGSKLTIGAYQIYFSTDYWETKLYDDYAEISTGSMGWPKSITAVMTDLCDIIKWSGLGNAQQYGDETLEVYDFASITTAIQNELKIVGNTGIVIRVKDTFGGVTLMWPSEWGDPPEPPQGQTWRQYTAVAKIIDDVNERWKANVAFRAEMEERHTGVFRPAHDGWKPELMYQILNDMKGVLQYLKYTAESMQLVVWSQQIQSPSFNEPRFMTNFSQAVAGVNIDSPFVDYGDEPTEVSVSCGGAVTIMGYVGSLSWASSTAFGFRANVNCASRVVGEEYEYGWTPDSMNWDMVTYSPMIQAYGFKARLEASEFLLSRYAGRSAKCVLMFWPHEYGVSTSNPRYLFKLYDDWYLESDGTPARVTSRCLAIQSTDGKYSLDCNFIKDTTVGAVPVIYTIDLPITAHEDTEWVFVLPKVAVSMHKPLDRVRLEDPSDAECLAMAICGVWPCSLGVLLDIDPMGLIITEEFDVTF